jgi:di/tricarboxylate transporter
LSRFWECSIFFSPLVLLLFGMIYTAALSEFSRMTRHLGISCFIFIANIILQGVLVLVLAVLVSAYD